MTTKLSKEITKGSRLSVSVFIFTSVLNFVSVWRTVFLSLNPAAMLLPSRSEIMDNFLHKSFSFNPKYILYCWHCSLTGQYKIELAELMLVFVMCNHFNLPSKLLRDIPTSFLNMFSALELLVWLEALYSFPGLDLNLNYRWRHHQNSLKKLYFDYFKPRKWLRQPFFVPRNAMMIKYVKSISNLRTSVRFWLLLLFLLL